MVLAAKHVHNVAIFLLLALAREVVANAIESVFDANSTREATTADGPPRQQICEARTINYITHTLPQSCLTSSWQSQSSTVAVQSTHQPANDGGATHVAEETGSRPTTTTTAYNSVDTSITEPSPTTFMSFEDWKEMKLRQAGQDPQEWRSRKPRQHTVDDRHPPDDGHAGLGEEEEISLNFENLADKEKEKNEARPAGEIIGDKGNDPAADETEVYGADKASVVHRSKDAGKTCKERFSYSSFDAGATVLKTSSGAKNAKAILVENKDSYMLLECSAPSKYVIVELSDDIWVDTVVLANFEFFSSMVRQFRVSVSDRYPVKMDKWRELGTFEARNSRDIQPFLVKNPHIYAKYVRIEFLTHFGNEYYCPVSLLRIHGSRMLDSWKDSETNRDDEALLDADEPHDLNLLAQSTDLLERSGLEAVHSNLTESEGITPWIAPHLSLLSHRSFVCPASPDLAILSPEDELKRSPHSSTASKERGDTTKHSKLTEISATPTASTITSARNDRPLSNSTSASTSGTTSLSTTDNSVGGSNVTGSNSSSGNGSAGDRYHNATASTSKLSVAGGSTGKPRPPAASGSVPASPTAQEGFFNAITRRLQQVESNLTLSLKYVEDQSKHVQEALQRGEQHQHAKVAIFLDELNQTVLSELHNIRDQYDQIWQSTVLALESQRDRSERDMMALSTRLNLLADEVVFQKRMAIVQAVILLSCLFLIIFSRGVPIPSFAPLVDQSLNSTCPTPLSPSTPRQPLYTREDRVYGEDRNASPCGNALRRMSLSDLDDDVKGSLRSSESNEVGARQCTNGFDGGSSTYQRLSPPATPNNPSEDYIRSDTPDTTLEATSDLMRLSAGIPHASTRKPLPSLPEHPRSSSEI